MLWHRSVPLSESFKYTWEDSKIVRIKPEKKSFIEELSEAYNRHNSLEPLYQGCLSIIKNAAFFGHEEATFKIRDEKVKIILKERLEKEGLIVHITWSEHTKEYIFVVTGWAK